MRTRMMAAFSIVVVAGTIAFLEDARHGSAGDGAVGPPYVPGEILVKFNPEAQDADRKDARSLLEATRLSVFRSGGERWRLGEGVGVESAVGILRGNPLVEYAEPNYYVHLADTLPPGPDPDFLEQWALRNTGQTVNGFTGTPDADIDAELAWDIETGSSTVVVAIIDVGVDYTHPDLMGNIWSNPGEVPGNLVDDDGNGFVDDVHGWDFWCPALDCELVCLPDHCDPFGVRDPIDTSSSGHGTLVAGIIGAEAGNGLGIVGVNWNVSIMALKGGPNRQSPGQEPAIVSAVVESIDYAVTMGADIINISAGFGQYSQALYDSMSDATNSNVLFTVASGSRNPGRDLDGNEDFYPAEFDLEGIITVAASDLDDRTYNSNYGVISVDLHAPGRQIRSTKPGNNYDYANGTSFAAPHVAGVAALLKAHDPGISVAELKGHILAGVDPIPELSGLTVTGGRLNAYGALQSLVQQGGGGGPPEPPVRR